VQLAISPAVPATLHNTVLPTFSLSFSLRGIIIYYSGLDRDLPLPSLHSFSLRFSSCLGHNLPLSSDIFTSAPHATAYQTSPITSSNNISDLPIPAHLTPNLASSSPSPHLTSPLTSPVLVSILFRLPRTHLAAMCATRLVSFRFGLPMTLVQTHILRPSDLFVTIAPHSLSSTSITITILPALDQNGNSVLRCIHHHQFGRRPFHYKRPRPSNLPL